MNWKSWPYWLKGGVIGVGVVIAGAVILSLFAAGSSLCGLNISGPGESHVCTLSERIEFFFSGLSLLLIAPFIATAHNFLEYRSWEMLTQTDDLFHFFLVLLGVPIMSGILGYLYGKFKNRRHLST